MEEKTVQDPAQTHVLTREEIREALGIDEREFRGAVTSGGKKT